jgi:hypothetical protein
MGLHFITPSNFLLVSVMFLLNTGNHLSDYIVSEQVGLIVDR